MSASFINIYRFLICTAGLFLYSCNSGNQEKEVISTGSQAIQKIIPDSNRYPAAVREHRFLALQKEWCKKLSLYEASNGTDSFEVRLWKEKGDHIPLTLTLMKWYKGKWTKYCYSFFQRHGHTGPAQQQVDSFSVQTCDPLNNNWKPFLDSLDIPSAWSLPSQSELPGNYGGLPGESFVVELVDKRKYKILFYADPASFVQEKNHRVITNFIRHFTSGPGEP